MDTITQIEVRGLERKAALLERQATEVETETAMYRRRGPQEIQTALARAERYRRQARELRKDAARLREQNP